MLLMITENIDFYHCYVSFWIEYHLEDTSHVTDDGLIWKPDRLTLAHYLSLNKLIP